MRCRKFWGRKNVRYFDKYLLLVVPKTLFLTTTQRLTRERKNKIIVNHALENFWAVYFYCPRNVIRSMSTSSSVRLLCLRHYILYFRPIYFADKKRNSSLKRIVKREGGQHWEYYKTVKDKQIKEYAATRKPDQSIFFFFYHLRTSSFLHRRSRLFFVIKVKNIDCSQSQSN